jgi:glycerol dehydrogenase-like iron-containing ADH family enzyme
MEGNTNVLSLRAGRDAARGLGLDIGRFTAVTMEIPWKVTADRLGARPEKVVMVETVEEAWLEAQLEALPPCDTILGIGGGQAVDAAKYIAWRKGLRLVSIPTILSVNAFATPAAGIRRNHEVAYVGTASPDPLVIDFGILRTAPPELNIAGIGDLLSIHTASFDWAHAHQRGRSEFPFSPAAVDSGGRILDRLYERLPQIRANTDEGLMAIVDGYLDLNRICLGIGHFRIEEGSEHYLFYELEERLGRPFVHGYIIGMGIRLMSRLQGNDPDGILTVMQEAGLPADPAILGISRADLKASLLNLRHFVEHRPHLWYTCINDADIDAPWADQALEGLRFR